MATMLLLLLPFVRDTCDRRSEVHVQMNSREYMRALRQAQKVVRSLNADQRKRYLASIEQGRWNDRNKRWCKKPYRENLNSRFRFLQRCYEEIPSFDATQVAHMTNAEINNMGYQAAKIRIHG